MLRQGSREGEKGSAIGRWWNSKPIDGEKVLSEDWSGTVCSSPFWVSLNCWIFAVYHHWKYSTRFRKTAIWNFNSGGNCHLYRILAIRVEWLRDSLFWLSCSQAFAALTRSLTSQTPGSSSQFSLSMPLYFFGVITVGADGPRFSH